jgi:hypothetical protein
MTIVVSSCLPGEKVRYDGGNKHDRFITDILGRFFWLALGWHGIVLIITTLLLLAGPAAGLRASREAIPPRFSPLHG